VVLEQHPDCLSARAGRQLPLDGLLGDQPNGPTRPPFRRFAADHGDNALFLGSAQKGLRARSLFVIQRAIQATPAVTVSNLANTLRRQGHRLRNLGRSGPLGELPENQGAQDDTHLLNAGARQLLDASEVLGLDFDGDRASRHTSMMDHNIL
jgi:hypothetical protein